VDKAKIISHWVLTMRRNLRKVIGMEATTATETFKQKSKT